MNKETNTIEKYMESSNHPGISKAILGRKIRGFSIPDYELHGKVHLIRTVWY